MRAKKILGILIKRRNRTSKLHSRAEVVKILMVSNAFMDKRVETIYQTNAFQLTIEFCICMKTSFSPVVTPFPPNVGCLFPTFKKGEGEASFHEGRDQNLHQGKRLVIFMCLNNFFMIVVIEIFYQFFANAFNSTHASQHGKQFEAIPSFSIDIRRYCVVYWLT